MLKQTKESIRKSIHLSSLIIPFGYKYIMHFNRRMAFTILLGALVLALIIEFYRFWQPSFRKVFLRLFGLILRRHEKKDFTGATYLLFSSMLCIAFFPAQIAFCAIAFLAIGDTFAAMVGINFGKRKFLGMSKSLEGSLACFVSTLVFGVFFLDHPLIAVGGAFAATLAELLPIPVDDNVKIPLISGFSMVALSIVI